MQEKAIDSRSFQEIWKSLSQDEKSDLALKLYNSKCCTTYQTIWNWGTGKTRPAALAREVAASVVGRFIGTRCLGSVLFPES